MLDASVFADAEKDHAVDGALDGEVEVSLGQVLVAQGEVAGEEVAPALDFFEELGVDFSCAALAAPQDGVLIERALEHGVLGEQGSQFVPFLGVLVVSQVQGPPLGGLVGPVRPEPAVIDGEFLEVSEDGEGELGRPGVPAKLVGGFRVALDADCGLLGLEEELARAANAKAVVWGFGGTADLDSVFMDDVLVRFCVPLLVGDVPPQGLEERVNELAPDLRFVVVRVLVGVAVRPEAVDELGDLVWYGHQ